MAAASVGQIGLDLVLNRENFNRDLGGLQKTAAKVGKTLAAAFTVKAITDFGKQCLELGSDLDEVQNVVDVTFKTMSGQMDQWAQNAAENFGLSETMAKQYAGTFGSMAEAFGFTEAEAYEMSTTLAGLAGDVASFYNLSQDTAYTKLKSVFSGETETLKDLGIVMTQTSLDAYAMANGFGKTTKQMTEAEKVSLRYAFVQDQLANATGDFARTSDSWANQIRILNLRFDSLKATIGQGLINLFTPIVRVANTVIGRLSTLANAFKSFTELITGKKSGNSAMGTAAKEADEAAESVSGVTDAANGATDAVNKTAKAIRSLQGFDVMEKLPDASSTNSGGPGGSGSSGGAVAGDPVDYGSLAEGETVLDEVDGKFRKIIDRFKELQEKFSEGFTVGLGDTSVFSSIEKSLQAIGDGLKSIFDSEDVKEAASRYADSLAASLGTIAGSVVSIGATIADNLLGGLAGYLGKPENIKRIQDYIVGMFDTTSRLYEKYAELSAAIADVFSVFRSDDAKGITEDIIKIFSDVFMGATILARRFGEDTVAALSDPFINNKDKIKKAVENTIKPVREVLDTVADAVRNMVDKVLELYEGHISPFIKDLSDGISEIVGVLLDGYNKHVAPVLDKLAKKFEETVNKYLLPAFESVCDAAGSFVDLLDALWKNIILPLDKALAESFGPVLAALADIVGGAILDNFNQLFAAIKAVSDIVGAVFGTITKIINGDLDFKATFKAVKDKAFDSVVDVWNGIKDKVAELTAKLADKAGSALTKLHDRWEDVKSKTSELTAKLADKAGNALTKLHDRWEDVKSKTSELTAKLADKAGSALASIHGKWTDIKSKTSELKTTFKNSVGKAFDTVYSKWKSFTSFTATLTAKFKDFFTAPLKKAWNGIANGINGAISVINKIPGVNISKIKPLAQGGFVKANTPQLAVIGDNTREGEIVAPESKLRAMADAAASQAQNGDMQQVITLLQEIVQLLSSLDPNVYLDGVKITKKVIQEINNITSSTKSSPLII